MLVCLSPRQTQAFRKAHPASLPMNHTVMKGRNEELRGKKKTLDFSYTVT